MLLAVTLLIIRNINILVTVGARFDSATALPWKRDHLAAFLAFKGVNEAVDVEQ
jgi:hypothetical protein